jgi:transaldolase/glucose-6-phosphate isomerase
MSVKVGLQTYKLPEALAVSVKKNIDDWRSADKVRRLWQHDASLWTGDDEANWLGWLDITAEQIANLDPLRAAVADAKKENFTDILLLGMGGSSLCPDVLRETFGKIAGFPELHVLDSTDPAQVKAFENKVDLAKTLFIVSSKSGTTLEPNIFKQYFFERAQQTVGADKAGSRFIAITDPGSKLQQVAEADHFRHIFFGRASIGGRYSALSNFGVVPAGLMGLDLNRFLSRTQEMVEACGANVPADQNPGALLGVILGTAARNGRDKLTILTSPGINALGAWLEQLVAESTGKQGKGIIPVDREAPGAPDV